MAAETREKNNKVTRPYQQKHHAETRDLWKSAVHRSAVRSNASTKFLQNYAGRRVRQPRTPNTSAERKFTNLIKLKQCRVKKTVSPSTPTCWRQASSFRSRRNTISHRETQTQQTRKRKRNKGDVFPLLICLMSSYVTQQLLFIKMNFWHQSFEPMSQLVNSIPGFQLTNLKFFK